MSTFVQENQLGFLDLLSILVDHCAEDQTGIVHFVTEANHAASFHISSGAIVALRYRMFKGMRAVPAIKMIRSAQYSFEPTPNVSFDEPSLPDTVRLLRELGWTEAALTDLSEVYQTNAGQTIVRETGVRKSGVRQTGIRQSALRQTGVGRAAGISTEIKAELEELLVEHLGPIASVVAQQVFAATDDVAEAVQMLAEEIPDQRHSEAFLQEARQLLS